MKITSNRVSYEKHKKVHSFLQNRFFFLQISVSSSIFALLVVILAHSVHTKPGYGHKKKCHIKYVTVYDTIYDTFYAKKCSTSYKKKCKTVYETKYLTKYKKNCDVHYVPKCHTSYKTIYEKKCDVSYDYKV